MKAVVYKKSRDASASFNLHDYDAVRRSFDWSRARKELDWFDGKINAAYNAVDRHTHTWRKNKVALYFLDPPATPDHPRGREEKYTFLDLKNQ